MRQQQQQDMDVTFTNVLEGARQYFQGLPAAQDSAANVPPSSRSYDHGAIAACYTGATKQHPNNVAATSRPEDIHPSYVRNENNTPHPPYNIQHNYWMAQNNEMKENANKERLEMSAEHHRMNQNHNQIPNHSQDGSKSNVQNYHYQASSSQAYQYSRLMSNSANSQYSTSYTHVPHQNVHQSMPAQNSHRVVPSRPQEQASKIHSYQQMQAPKQHLAASHSETMYHNGYQQTTAYYPPHSKPQSPAAPPPSSQSYHQQNNQSHQYSQSYHSQSPVQTQTQYLSTRSNEENIQQQMMQQNSQQRRTTHNLPPIAALSSVNYHSNKNNREVVQRVGAVQKQRSQTQPYNNISATVPASINTSSVTTVPATIYSNSQVRPSAIYQTSQRQNTYPQQNTVINNNHHLVNHNSSTSHSATTEQYHQYPTAATTSYPSTSVNSSNSKIVYPQSSYHQYFQKLPATSNKLPQEAPTQRINPQQQNVNNHQQRTEVATVINEALNPKQKRESPLDLSVKTVRTSADSTALDDEAHNSELHRINKNLIKSRVENKHAVYQTQNGNPSHYNHQQNVMRNSQVSVSAPKVDFLPNFSPSALQNQHNSQFQQTKDNNIKVARTAVQEHDVYYQRQQSYQMVNNHNNRQYPVYHTTPQETKQETLPRFEFPLDGNNGYKKPGTIAYTQPMQDSRKRPIEQPNEVPNKIPKYDTWKQKMDQQIEQRLSSYANSRAQQEQIYQQQVNNQQQFAKPVNQVKPTVPNNSAQYYPQYRQYSETPQINHGYDPSQQHYQQNQTNNYDMYVQNSLNRSNSMTKLPTKVNNVGSQADKRILSLLRNSLESKGAKEAQKKMDQNVKPVPLNSGIQQPTTDVSAPLQPKPSIHIRHNVSPFTASGLLERTNTPTSYKFHFPRAVDSIKYETETQIKDDPSVDVKILQDNPAGANTGTSDLDGLAAFLAARIRTKAELKQVGINQEQKSSDVTVSPPKLSREQALIPPRRKLFSKSEEDLPVVAAMIPNGTINIPARNTALRSSSETSVFDFPDSDSETEMPVLERQSLHDMRKDRKSQIKVHLLAPPEDIKEEPVDTEWDDICGKFVEQLQHNNGKKRGRRKKLEPEVLAKLETVTKENPLPEMTVPNLDIVKKEKDVEEVVEKENIPETIPNFIEPPKIKQEKLDDQEAKSEAGSDDVPLNKIKCPIKKEENLSEDEEVALISKKTEKSGAKIRLEYSSDSDSDSNISPNKLESVSRKLFARKSRSSSNPKEPKDDKGMVLRSADSSPAKTQMKIYLKKKAIYGDGSEFHVGWEEEVYRYKRSVRMPASLITISRPHWHRMSTSLPDLDACSPAPSSLTDDTDFIPPQRGKSLNSIDKIKRENLDSDSNSSFTKNDTEEPSGSKVKKSVNKNNKISEKNSSILDVLIERYGKHKRKKNKYKYKGPKIIEKNLNPLLPTPSLGIGNEDSKNDKLKRGKTKVKEDDKKEEAMELNNSVYLGFFRKQTVTNFPDTFKGIEDSFSPVLLKSRTRTEARVMKKRATIREVFGEDRPASAPPITVVEEIKEEPLVQEEKIDAVQNLKNKEKQNELKTTPTKKLNNIKKSKSPDDEKIETKNSIASESPDSKSSNSKSTTPDTKSSVAEFDDKISIKSETMSVTGDEAASDVSSTVSGKKRLKLRNIRRKFSSGFDYIRKKKKVIKKENMTADDKAALKRRRGFAPRPNPESESDIQKEIKTWVMNKGVGETHLHRAARLGYTVSNKILLICYIA